MKQPKTTQVVASVYGVTNVSIFGMKEACDQVGIPFTSVDDKLAETVISPRRQRVFVDTKVLFVPSARICYRLLAKVHRDLTPRLIFVSDGQSELLAHRIVLYPYRTVTGERLIQLLDAPEPQEIILQVDKHDIIGDLLDKVKDQTLYQSVHALFYRIRDKEERAKAQADVFRYLCGVGRSLPEGLPTTMVNVLKSDRAKSLRSVMVYARAHGLQPTLDQYPDSDEFEISYLLNKFGKLKESARTKKNS